MKLYELYLRLNVEKLIKRNSKDIAHHSKFLFL
jgi:hypothetical protein